MGGWLVGRSLLLSYPTAFIERLDLRRLKEEDKIVPDPAIPLNQGGNINSTR